VRIRSFFFNFFGAAAAAAVDDLNSIAAAFKLR